MDAIAGLTFREASILLGILAIPPLLAFLIWRARARERLANRFVSEAVRGVANRFRSTRPFLIAAGVSLALVAFAGPRFGSSPSRIEVEESNRVVVLDLSHSMRAADAGVSRLDAAKGIAKRLFESHGGPAALVVFEGSAEVVAPLTRDVSALIALLESLSTGELDESGSRIESGLRSALALVGAASRASELILISDGEDATLDRGRVAKMLRESGASLIVVTLGSPSGTVITLEDGALLRDEGGEPVLTRAQPNAMENLASAAGGVAYSNPARDQSLRSLSRTADRIAAKSLDGNRVPMERFQFPLALSLAILVLGSFAHRGAE